MKVLGFTFKVSVLAFIRSGDSFTSVHLPWDDDILKFAKNLGGIGEIFSSIHFCLRGAAILKPVLSFIGRKYSRYFVKFKGSFSLHKTNAKVDDLIATQSSDTDLLVILTFKLSKQ